MHPIVNTIRNLLEKEKVWYSFMQHQEATTSEEAARARDGYSLSEGCKALLIKAGERYIQVVVPGDKKFSNKKVRSLLGVSDICFATPEEVNTITDNIQPGGIPPFAHLFSTPLPVYVDEGIFDNEKIVFSCGMRSVSIAMKSSDYKHIVQPTIASLTA